MDIKRFYQNSKLVYSSKKVSAQKIALEYISVSAGDFAPIHLKIAVLLYADKAVKRRSLSILLIEIRLDFFITH